MFDYIINWIIDNKDSLISNVLIGSLFLGITRLLTLKNKIPRAIKSFKNLKAIKYLGFIILYVFPIGIIIFMIFDKSMEPTFKNIALFIIICITLIFNVIMNYIISIYKMIKELTSKSSHNDITHKKAINLLFESVGRKERIE